MHSEDFDAVFYPGGHGPMQHLIDKPDSFTWSCKTSRSRMVRTDQPWGHFSKNPYRSQHLHPGPCIAERV